MLQGSRHQEVCRSSISEHFQGLRHCTLQSSPVKAFSSWSIFVHCFSVQVISPLNRLHVTRVADSYSSLGFPCSGIPQGSILGPTLFSAFINDLPSVLPSDSTALFADDITICIISDNLPSLNSTLQLTLDLWLEGNGLKRNTLKTKCMLIHSARKKVNSGLELRIDGMDVEQVQCFRFLGVLVNDTLTWSDHIDMVSNKVTCSLNLLRCLLGFSLSLSFFSISSLTFFPLLTTVMLSGLDAPRMNLFAWKFC